MDVDLAPVFRTLNSLIQQYKKLLQKPYAEINALELEATMTAIKNQALVLGFIPQFTMNAGIPEVQLMKIDKGTYHGTFR